MDYTNLTPEQAAIQARAETLKEIIEMCLKEKYKSTTELRFDVITDIQKQV